MFLRNSATDDFRKNLIITSRQNECRRRETTFFYFPRGVQCSPDLVIRANVIDVPVYARSLKNWIDDKKHKLKRCSVWVGFVLHVIRFSIIWIITLLFVFQLLAICWLTNNAQWLQSIRFLFLRHDDGISRVNRKTPRVQCIHTIVKRLFRTTRKNGQKTPRNEYEL